ncbi:hypothetical protein BH23PSE1_BH23PSE1_10620 [soil metagenome]
MKVSPPGPGAGTTGGSDTLSRAERAIAGAFDGAAMAMMAALVVVIGWSVLARQVLHIPVPWATEVASSLCLWMVATGSVAAWARREHIVIDVMLRRLEGGMRRTLAGAIEIGSLILLGVVLDGSIRMMSTSANNMTTALQISFSWLYLALAIAAAGMIAFSLAHLARLALGRG